MRASRKTVLDDNAIKRLIAEARESGERIEVSDDRQTGLMLRVSSGGDAVWYLACKQHGRNCKVRLGVWPILSRHKAVIAALGKREDIRRGVQGVATRWGDHGARSWITYRDLIARYDVVEGNKQASWHKTKRRQLVLMKDMLDRRDVEKSDWQAKFDLGRLVAALTG